MPLTLENLAKQVNKSISTISYVLRGYGYELKERNDSVVSDSMIKRIYDHYSIPDPKTNEVSPKYYTPKSSNKEIKKKDPISLNDQITNISKKNAERKQRKLQTNADTIPDSSVGIVDIIVKDDIIGKDIYVGDIYHSSFDEIIDGDPQVQAIIQLCISERSETIDLGNLNLVSVPKELFKLDWLRLINFGSRFWDALESKWKTTVNVGKPNRITIEDLSKFEGRFPKLKSLALNDISLSDISRFPIMDSLEHLWMNGNNISDITPITELASLTELSLSNNNIQDISSISKLSNLKQLSLENNKIKDISSLKDLPNLVYLNLSKNIITDVSKLAQLPRLENLEISNNIITHIEPLIFKLNLKHIGLNGNKIEDCPEEIWTTNDFRQIEGYFQAEKRREESQNQSSKPSIISKQQEVKLILVGNSGAGKTQLREFLTTGTIGENRQSTHGIEVSVLKKDPRQNLHSPLNDLLPDNFIVNIWDFGGQEYYHGTHRLFLSNKAVYLLLWESGTNCNKTLPTLITDTQIAELDHFDYLYWIESIRSYAPDSPILLVQNKVDSPDLVRERISKTIFETHNIQQDAFYISLHETVKGNQFKHRRLFKSLCEEMCEVLSDMAGSQPYTHEWLHIREAIRAAQDGTENEFYKAIHIGNRTWINIVDFHKICEVVEPALKESKNELLALTTWLDFSGCLIHYADNPKLSDKVFLDPQWITKGIYDILNERILKKHGVFSISDFGEQDNPNASLFITLMEQMEIVFQHPTIENTYIAPQYLNEEHPIEELFAIAETGLTQSSFRVRVPLFFYRKLMHQLILYFGTEADVVAKYYWKHGVMIMTKGQTRCIIKGLYPKKDREGIILIGVEKTSESRQVQKEIFERILIILSKQEKDARRMLQPEALGQKNSFQSTLLSDSLQMGSGEIFPEGWTKEYRERPVPRWLNILEVAMGSSPFYPYLDLCTAAENGILKIQSDDGQSVAVKDFEVLLDKTVPRPLKIFLSYANSEAGLMRRLNTHLAPLRRLDKIESWTDQEIMPGEYWDYTIRKKLEEADIILLLLSADFIASDYIWEKELKILENRKDCTVIPILLQPVDLQGLEIYKRNAVPFFFEHDKGSGSTDGRGKGSLRAITLWENMELGFSEVAKVVRQAVDNILEGKIAVEYEAEY